MNNKIKHNYTSNIQKNVNNSFVWERLYTFFDKKNIVNSNILFLEKTKEIDIQYITYLQKNKKYWKKIKTINKKENVSFILDKIKMILFIIRLQMKKINVHEEKVQKKIKNAQILAKIVAYTLKTKRFRIIKNKIKKYLHFINNEIISTYVKGLKISVNGRLNKDRIVPRKTTRSFRKGRFKGCLYLDKGRVTIKNKKGHFTVTVIIAIN